MSSLSLLESLSELEFESDELDEEEDELELELVSEPSSPSGIVSRVAGQPLSLDPNESLGFGAVGIPDQPTMRSFASGSSARTDSGKVALGNSNPVAVVDGPRQYPEGSTPPVRRATGRAPCS